MGYQEVQFPKKFSFSFLMQHSWRRKQTDFILFLTIVVQKRLFEWILQNFITEGNQNIYVWVAWEAVRMQMRRRMLYDSHGRNLAI